MSLTFVPSWLMSVRTLSEAVERLGWLGSRVGMYSLAGERHTTLLGEWVQIPFIFVVIISFSFIVTGRIH